MAVVISTAASFQRQLSCSDLRRCIHPVSLVLDRADVVQRRMHPCLLSQNNAREPFGKGSGHEELAILHIGRNRKTVLAVGGDTRKRRLPRAWMPCFCISCPRSVQPLPGCAPPPPDSGPTPQAVRLLLELKRVTSPLRLRLFRYPFALDQHAKGSFCGGKVHARNAGYDSVKIVLNRNYGLCCTG